MIYNFYNNRVNKFCNSPGMDQQSHVFLYWCELFVGTFKPFLSASLVRLSELICVYVEAVLGNVIIAQRQQFTSSKIAKLAFFQANVDWPDQCHDLPHHQPTSLLKAGPFFPFG